MIPLIPSSHQGPIKRALKPRFLLQNTREETTKKVILIYQVSQSHLHLSSCYSGTRKSYRTTVLLRVGKGGLRITSDTTLKSRQFAHTLQEPQIH